LIALGYFVVITVPDEYLEEHVFGHITKNHLPKIFAWTLGTLVILAALQHYVDLDGLIKGHTVWILLLAALIGILPDSGPHLLFLFLYAHGSIPFSVLLTSSIVQDGHGMLPLLSTSVKKSVQVKTFNLVFGLAVGLGAYACEYYAI
jgi:hypothetical protein